MHNITADDITIIDNENPIAEAGEKEVIPNQGAPETPAIKDDAGADKPPVETPEAPEVPTAEAEAPVENFDWLKESTNGKASSKEELANLIAKYEQELATGKEPKSPEFPNEGAKKLYEFALKYGDGKQLDGAMQYIQVQGLDLEKMDPKEVLFQNFLLNEENKDLDKDKAREIFEAQIEDRYSEYDLESKAHIKYAYDKEVKSAKENIANLQREYQEGITSKDTTEQEQRQALNTMIETELPSFKGVNFSLNISENGDVSLGEYDPKNPDQNVSFEIPKEDTEKFQNALKDPTSLWTSMHLDSDGNLNMKAYMKNIFNLMYGEKIQNTIASEAFTKGQSSKLKELKNIKPEVKEESGGEKGDPWLEGIEKAQARR